MPRSAVALARFALAHDTPNTDAQLLSAFIASRAENPFAELVRRHGSMVLAVCRRVLSDPHDAEDAFQATFLVLARKAGSVRGANVAGWLYGVAVRTARGVRLARDRRERRADPDRKRDHTSPAPAPGDALAVAEQAAIVDEELARLPELYRVAVVLCELRGLSRREAATELGVPEGTVSSRLAAAKRKLASRLAARGVAPSVALAVLTSGSMTVSAELTRATTGAVSGAAGGTAGAAAAVVLKAMLFDQLRAGAVVGAVCLALACGGLAMTGSADAPPARGNATAPAPHPVDDSMARLIAQLGSESFAEREAAEKALRAHGTKAEPALTAGLRSDDPEVRARCAVVLVGVRKDALAALVKGFDPKVEPQPAHPIWKRFQAITGNTSASRELFARILKRPEWVARLDAAEANPAAAARQYRDAVTEIGTRFQSNMAVFFRIPVWPADTAEEAAYLLFLGSYPGTETAPPANDTRALFSTGEGRLHYAKGMSLGLRGLEIAPGPEKRYDATAALPSGSDRVFWKLLAAWLPRRADTSVLYNSFDLAVVSRAADVLPAARLIAGDGKRSAGERCGALRAVAQFGAASDLPLFAELYGDDTPVVFPPPPSRYSPGPRSRRLIASDHAVALALLLCDQDPFEYGFARAKGLFQRENRRPVIAGYGAEDFGFNDDPSRAAAHAKARAFLDEQKPKGPKKPPAPVAAQLVEQLGSESFAEREAAEEKLKELGAPAKAAVLAGLKSDNPEIARRCAAVLPVLRRADWQRAAAAFAANPDTFKHPVWTKLKAVTGAGPDARAIFAELLANERAFVGIVEAIENPNAAERLHRAAHARLAQDLKGWYAADAKRNAVTALTQWSPERGTYPAMLLLGTFPGTEAVPAHRVRLDAPRDEHTAWHACWAGLGAEQRPAPGALGRPPAALQRLFVAWLGARENPDAAVSGFSTLLMLDCREGAALAHAVAADAKRTERARGWALLYLAQGGTAADTAAAVAAFGDAREFASSRERTLQMRDIATAVALKLNGEEPADWGFSVRRGAAALKSAGPHQLGFTSNFVRDPLLKAAQAKVAELTAPLRTAPAPRAKP
ncbi:ECF RNA polymerase sigma factor SigE [Gemmata obscuriglobus]|uniref:ECF RNA polymerase sigma factor SigE n=1 Tax=Gemmata obscuriglobus TaxID=114 RepID=A0A2Z3GZL6_9BACT|nr:RNA polymerase sigma factor [Gemmata obscuriglobus]AWM39959.1 hypothetical protein C1280_25100 [Gemmata obscuriglobus]QEG26897.1 ECF RNA polymerase sigma factor SigE [Gemmata obscuriglobus]VTS02982.1 sigma-70 family rna polymerase sigma factor : RNA polymerase sigma factor, sigma-70 family OS=Singulisphaera acidiphila (strain ATCC BAA-1392 / DSM 18658 / VKM B-2454 / MOB10) GN=Sinac_4264 PE=4 SV=1: Sigma70_r2: Sigma70_r4_2 [Gemmata obscuriglobus UQM 2246]